MGDGAWQWTPPPSSLCLEFEEDECRTAYRMRHEGKKDSLPVSNTVETPSDNAALTFSRLSLKAQGSVNLLKVSLITDH